MGPERGIRPLSLLYTLSDPSNYALDMTSHLVWWPAQRGDKLRNILSCFAQFVTPELVMSWAPAPLFIVLSQKSSSNRGGPRYDYPPWWWRPAQRGDKLRNNLSCIAQFVTPELVMSWAPSTLFHSERPNRGSQIYDPASLEIKSKYSWIPHRPFLFIVMGQT